MQVFINGIEKELVVPYDSAIPKVEQIDETSHIIDYGNNLIEVCGTKVIQTSAYAKGIEGVATISLPQGKILSVNATAENVSASGDVLMGENAFVRVSGESLVLYATANSNQPHPMKVHYSVKILS